MVANAVSTLVADLKYPLSGVSELVFQRLEEGLIVGKICGMSGEHVFTNIIYC
jgi:hypothetical protein